MAHILIQCQQKVVHDQMDTPVPNLLTLVQSGNSLVLAQESANGDLLYILNKSEKKAKKVQLPAPIDNRGNRWPDEIPPP